MSSESTTIYQYLLRGPQGKQAELARLIGKYRLCNFLAEEEDADRTVIPDDCYIVVAVCDRESAAIARVLLDGDQRLRVAAVIFEAEYLVMTKPARWAGRVFESAEAFEHVLMRGSRAAA